MNISRVLRWVSFLFPVPIKKYKAKGTETLHFYLHKSWFRLDYGDVHYSNGIDYLPLKTAFEFLDQKLENYSQVLVLGAGVGSAGMLLHKFDQEKKWNITYVDNNQQILGLCRFATRGLSNVDGTYILDDAFEAMAKMDGKFDMICVDIFVESTVPDSVFTKGFLVQLKQLSNANASIVFNTMFAEEIQEQAFYALLTKHFSQVHLIENGINKVFVVE